MIESRWGAPIMILAIFSVLSLVLWNGLVKQEELHIRHMVGLQAKSISHEIQEHIWTRINALERMAKRLEGSGYLSMEHWLADARLYVRHDPSYHALLWVDADNIVRGQLPSPGETGNGSSHDVLWQPDMLPLARARQARTISHVFGLSPGKPESLAMQIMVPIKGGKHAGGFVVAVYHLSDVLKYIISHTQRDGYMVDIHDGQAAIVSSHTAGGPHKQRAGQSYETQVRLPGVEWQVRLVPQARALVGMQGKMSRIILAGGFFVALLLAWATHLYLKLLGQTQALKASETKFRTLFGDSSDAIMLLDGMAFLDCNEAALRLFGCRNREQLLERPLTDFLPFRQPDGRDSVRLAKEFFETALKRGRNQFEWMQQRLNGSQFPAHVLLSVMNLGGRDVLQATVRDITEQEKVRDREKKLLRQNRFLIRKLMNSQESERSYIARELHDELGQSMTAIDTLATLIKAQSPNGSISDTAGKISEIVSNLFDHVRGILSRIRSPVFEATGLIEGVQELLDHYRRINGLECAFSVEGEFGDLSGEAITALYRVMQEALTNTVRHSRADRVAVRLGRAIRVDASGHDEDILSLEISDNGEGVVLESSDMIGLGMMGMCERVESLHGSCRFSSSPGGGMHISITVPLVGENIKEKLYGREEDFGSAG